MMLHANGKLTSKVSHFIEIHLRDQQLISMKVLIKKRRKIGRFLGAKTTHLSPCY